MRSGGVEEWRSGGRGAQFIKRHKTPLYEIPRRFLIVMRRTTISHFSFLISHSRKTFKRNQGGRH